MLLSSGVVLVILVLIHVIGDGPSCDYAACALESLALISICLAVSVAGSVLPGSSAVAVLLAELHCTASPSFGLWGNFLLIQLVQMHS